MEKVKSGQIFLMKKELLAGGQSMNMRMNMRVKMIM